MATTTVTSPLLSDPPAAPRLKERPVDPDFTKTVDAGYVESLEAFGARMDLRRIALLDLAAGGLFFAALALTGRHYLRETR